MFLTLAVLVGWLIVAGFIIPALVDAFMAERDERDRGDSGPVVADRIPLRLGADPRGDR